MLCFLWINQLGGRSVCEWVNECVYMCIWVNVCDCFRLDIQFRGEEQKKYILCGVYIQYDDECVSVIQIDQQLMENSLVNMWNEPIGPFLLFQFWSCDAWIVEVCAWINRIGAIVYRNSFFLFNLNCNRHHCEFHWIKMNTIFEHIWMNDSDILAQSISSAKFSNGMHKGF